MFATATLIGTVKSSKLVTGDKKPFLAIRIEQINGREWNGKTYRDRAELRVYRKPEELAPLVRPGMIVTATGTPKAEPFEYNGKTYANLTIMVGDFTVLQIGGKVQDADPAPQPMPQRRPVNQAPVKAVEPANEGYDANEDTPF